MAKRWWGCALTMIGLLWPPGVGRAPDSCPYQDVRKFPADTFGSSTWGALHHSYKRFCWCDNGGEFSTNYTEDVMRLLAANWERLHELANLVRKDPAFEQFVLRHINGAAATDDLAKIAASARGSCPE